jgi:hypothetical protein
MMNKKAIRLMTSEAIHGYQYRYAREERSDNQRQEDVQQRPTHKTEQADMKGSRAGG